MMRSTNLTGVPSFPQPSNSTLLTSLSSQNLCAHVFPKHSGVRWRSPPTEDLATNNALKLDKILLPQRRRGGKTTKSPIFHSTNFPPATQPKPTTTATSSKGDSQMAMACRTALSKYQPTSGCYPDCFGIALMGFIFPTVT